VQPQGQSDRHELARSRARRVHAQARACCVTEEQRGWCRCCCCCCCCCCW
jgi:hypothetical protein